MGPKMMIHWQPFYSALSVIAGLLLLVMPGPASAQEAGQDVNRILSVSVDAEGENPQVNIRTEKPVGYRYTVYDSFDPLRVVIDFPRMDVSEIKSPLPVNIGAIKEIRVVSFDLTLGKLGRIEILLDRKIDYDVNIEGTQFNVAFQPAAETAEPVSEQAPAATIAPAPAPAPAPAETERADRPEPLPAPEPEADALANVVENVEVEKGRVAIFTDAPIERYRYFNLGAPPRLVLDVFGVKPAFRERSLPGTDGFERIRVGTYDDKTRFVFDAGVGVLPDYEVDETGQGLVVTWTPGKTMAAPEARRQPQVAPAPIERRRAAVAPPAPEKEAVEPAPVQEEEVPEAAPQRAEPRPEPRPEPKPAPRPVPAPDPVPAPAPEKAAEQKPMRMATAPVSVEDLEFTIEDGTSVFSVELSGRPGISQPVQRGEVILFGIDNASIKRSLRRVIDTSAFPSAVSMITPYTVNRGTTQDVRFAVRLKGDVPYALKRQGGTLRFEVENGPFGQVAEAPPKRIEIPVPPVATTAQAPSAQPSAPTPAPMPEKAPTATPAAGDVAAKARAAAGERYTGQRISLIFDNADIRNLLQLIAEVSDLNIVASDEVKGNLSIRLIDVPWDQALDVILDTKQLGMLRNGNVVRILPKDKIRQMEESELASAKNRRELEPLETEVYSISYTDLGNIAGSVREMMTDRGRLTQDERNKKLIVKDIPPVLKEIGNLIEILDTPERQVMIEARIVEANSDYTRDLGINWGIHHTNPGSAFNALNVGLGGQFLTPVPDAGSASSGAGLGSFIQFGELGVDKTVIDLRISALESAGKGKIISRPRVTTLNGQEAVITQGTTIPYQTSGADGPKTEFVDAVLELQVTPIINPDNTIIMEINASNSAPGETFTSADLPGINKKEAKTKVLVLDGETTVIGGIFVEDDRESESGVPWLGRLPVLGYLFKSQSVEKRRSELLIFITPRILE